MPPTSDGRRRGLVIAWMPVSQRSATIAKRLDFDLVLVGRSGFQRPWSAPFTYPLLAARTVAAIVRRRPRAAIVIAPPFVAPLIAWPFLAALRAPFAIDVHSGALLDRRWRWSVGPLAWIARRAVVSVVTLESLREPLRSRGAVTSVIPDPLPQLDPGDGPVATAGLTATAGPPTTSSAAPRVVAICGWAADEPIDELVRAASGRPWRLALTGRPRASLSLPPNVELTGFLDDDAYVETLRHAAAIVVLTTRDQTLLSGGWEAIALGRPLVLSGTPSLRATFGDDVVYVGDDAESIAAGIDAVLADPDAAARVEDLRARFGRANDLALAELAAALGSAGPQSSSAARSADQAR